MRCNVCKKAVSVIGWVLGTAFYLTSMVTNAWVIQSSSEYGLFKVCPSSTAAIHGASSTAAIHGANNGCVNFGKFACCSFAVVVVGYCCFFILKNLFL